MQSVRTIIESNKNIRVPQRRLMADPDGPRPGPVESTSDAPSAREFEPITDPSETITDSNFTTDSITVRHQRPETGHYSL